MSSVAVHGTAFQQQGGCAEPMLKYREDQKELHCVFVDLEKIHERMPREELWWCVRKSGVACKGGAGYV